MKDNRATPPSSAESRQPAFATPGRRPPEAKRLLYQGLALDDADLVRRVVAAAKAAPAVRVERVEELRSQIATGTYVVPEDQLARRLLGVAS